MSGRYIPLGVRAANSSLRQIDPSLEESAQILGASWVTTMREVTLPLIRPGLFAGWLLVFVPVIQELSASILLFSSSSITLAVAVYNLYETGYIEPVAALAMINMVIIGVAIWLANRVGGGRIASRGERRAGECFVHGGHHDPRIVEELRRARASFAAVADLDLDIKDNSFVTLLGPSGCGKTTTLRLIAGYIVPDTGTIHVDERVLVLARRVVPPEARGMGMVFQNYAVWPHKTVFENVVFGLKLRKVPAAAAKKQVADDARAGQPHRAWRGAIRTSSPAASSSASRSRAAWWSSRRSYCSTSRCPTSTPSCASACAPSSRSCSAAPASPSSTSPTTRPRRSRCPTTSR